MILSCELCHTRYLIPATAFARGPRKVRCARCSHSWMADLPPNINVILPESTASASVRAAPEMPTWGESPPSKYASTSPPPLPPPLPPGSNLPALPAQPWPQWLKIAVTATTLFLAIALILWMFFDRAAIVKRWPFMGHLYDTVHLHVYYPGEGLSLTDVRSELQYEDGITKLKVEGTILNATDTSQPIPNVNVVAIGPGAEILQSWQIDAPAATVDAHGSVPFQSAINAPKGSVVNVNLTFIEPSDDHE